MSSVDRNPRTGAGAPVPAVAAVCGLYCEACSIYIGSHEDPQRLAALAARMGWSVEDAHCDGCRAERRTPYCRACTLFACAAGRGVSFCGECDDFPCAELDEFQRERPHRADLYEDLDRIADVGVDAWLVDVRRRFSCPSCGTLNSAYDLKCRGCGQEPASEFVAVHRAEILATLSRL